MTHSLYRKGVIEDLKNDYVIISMLARGFNDKSPEVKKNHLRIGEIFKQNNPTNILREGAWGVSTVIQGCFSDIKDVEEILQTVKKEDLGVSVVVSGLIMCGHHCVSSQSVEHYIDQIKKGKISLEKAAEKLTSPCVCGIFNTKRAMQVLSELIN